jgi:hypothetical protein
MEVCTKLIAKKNTTSHKINKSKIICKSSIYNLTFIRCNVKWCRSKISESDNGFCKEHKEGNITGRKGRFCLLCNKRASQNYPGFTRRIYCKDHAKEGMKDVSHGSCAFNGCFKRPNRKNKKYCMYHYKLFEF